MTTRTPRPIFVTLSLVIFWCELVIDLITTYSIGYTAFSRGGILAAAFILGVAMAVLILATIINIQNRRPLGRWFGIITLSVSILASFGSIWSLAHWKYGHNAAFYFAVVVVSVRMLISPVTLAAYIFSTSVRKYFEPDEEPFMPPPPPPTSFDD